MERRRNTPVLIWTFCLHGKESEVCWGLQWGWLGIDCWDSTHQGCQEMSQEMVVHLEAWW